MISRTPAAISTTPTALPGSETSFTAAALPRRSVRPKTTAPTQTTNPIRKNRKPIWEMTTAASVATSSPAASGTLSVPM